LQRKGFPYHFHPVTVGVALQAVAFVAWLAERGLRAGPSRWPLRLAPMLLAFLLAARTGVAFEGTPHVQSFWILEKGATKELRESRDYLIYFHGPDFFPADLHDAARFVREHTAPEDRVQMYAMDPYFLFLARRKSATPYIYAYDLDADTALTVDGPLGPNPAQLERIRQMRDEHEDDLLRRMQARPPAAFVFADKAPLMSLPDAERDFAEHCPRASAWVSERYREAARFGNIRVSLRRDLAGEPDGTARRELP
jgi:hypothetical protein